MSPTDTAVILYTSGTTGTPKGAELSHSNLMMNALAAVAMTHLNSHDVSLIALPLFHSFGQSVQMNASAASGGSMVLLPRFEAESAMAAASPFARGESVGKRLAAIRIRARKQGPETNAAPEGAACETMAESITRPRPGA